ncbi:MAG: hypothetical protein RBT86_07435 [Azospira sp.]|jgi:type II secretory pathway component GspD/PulD (secretin)|nr:hypothetical protein [Azospira sp.]
MNPVRRCLFLMLALLPLLAVAQQQMEIIVLRHRLLDQVLPALQPLLEPGGTLSGMNDRLILRASAKNRDEIRRALAAIDTPLRSLRIVVARSREAAAEAQGLDVYGSVGSDGLRARLPPAGNAAGGNAAGGNAAGGGVEIRRDQAEIGARVLDTRSARTAGALQTVQVVEGGRAFIHVGRSLPVPLREAVLGPGGAVLRETVVYRDIGQGFHVEPQLVGERVMLEISPRFDAPGHAGDGSANTLRLSTTVSGRLGEWIELGGSGRQASVSERSNLSSGTAGLRADDGVWLRVEEVR